MSVGLYKYNGDINDRNSKAIISESISSQSFYEEYWEKAIYELNIKYVQDGAEFNRSHLNIVMDELNLLKKWALSNLINKELEYMVRRIERLQEVIPNALKNDDDILYIF